MSKSEPGEKKAARVENGRLQLPPLAANPPPLKQQKIRIWRGSGGKIKMIRSKARNVYENKENMDKVTAKKPDIYGKFERRILQKNSGYYGQSGLIDTFRAGFMRIFVAKISPPPSRAERSAYSVSAGSVKTRADSNCRDAAPDGLQLPTQPRFRTSIPSGFSA